MNDVKWSQAEKKLARRVFEAALDRELAAVMAEFKQRAARASGPQEMWDVEDYLSAARREIDSKYDYRYSQLSLVFGRLLREGRIDEDELNGLSEDKLAHIRLIANF